MPISEHYQARSAAEIKRCFYDVDTGVERTTVQYANVVMAQPLGNDIPAFCLLIFGSDNKYDIAIVAKRWTYITRQLNKRNIEVLTFSSHSDPKLNSSMGHLLNLGDKKENSSKFPNMFNAGIFTHNIFHSKIPNILERKEETE